MTINDSSPSVERLASASLAIGILALACMPPLGIISIILGNRSRRLINNSNGELLGEGLAKIGIILGWIGVSITILIIVLLVKRV